MERQLGFFDIDDRLSGFGGQLETCAEGMDLDNALAYSDGDQPHPIGPPFDPVMMMKILIIQAHHNLSDDHCPKCSRVFGQLYT